MNRPDGTDRLLIALYGESSARTIGKAIGGSEAKMLHDAADLIASLKSRIAELEPQWLEQRALCAAFARE